MKENNYTRETSPNVTRSWPMLSILNHLKLIKQYERKSVKITKRERKRKLENFFHLKEARKAAKKGQLIKAFDPDNFLRVFWDVLILAITAYQCIIIPFILSFNPTPSSAVLSTVLATEILYFLDILVQINTAYYIYGAYIIDRKSIIWNYVKSWFILDVITFSPNFMYLYKLSYMPIEGVHLKDITRYDVLNYIWLLKLVRLAKMKKIIYLVEDSLSSPRFVAIIQILKFLLVAILWAHWISCITNIFYEDALLRYGDLYSMYKVNVGDRYLFMLYYAALTMTSCGFGSYFIISDLQMVNAMTTMFFECFLFGFLIGSIQTVIGKQTAEYKYWERIDNQLRKFMYKKDIPKLLRSKITQYIIYLRKSSKNNFNDDQILSCLSSQLRDEVYIQTRGQSLTDCPPFGIYPPSFLRTLGRNLTIKVHAPSDLIIKEGEMSNDVYFIQSGIVEIYHEATMTAFKQLKKGKYFGEISFFLDSTRSASARCLAYSELLSLSRLSMIRMFISRPNEKEITELLVKECEEDLSALGIKCYLCSKSGHIARDCELYRFQIDRDIVVFMANKEKHKWGKFVNLNDKIRRKIERKRKSANILQDFSLQNISGKSEPKFKRESIREKAEKLYIEKDFNGNTSQLDLIQEESNDEPEESTAVLPEYMRFREIFLKNSFKMRTNKQLSVNVPDLPDLEGDQYEDFLDSPC
ncbi:unnamed protein product [Blepharisma stoltei]|uniref:Cyclic nucleotide-binding domain-containing protein n=1 Tax=Blepharisma stoltei TaxID=1481888 RepID=A0AAU9JGG9_9CILI|nr:unnamed protein product [Blepharisma stoltei]